MTHCTSPRGDEFSMETRYVVLNFIGRVQTGSSLSSSLGSSTGRSQPSDGSRSPTKSTGSAASATGVLSKQTLGTLPDINMVDRFHECETLQLRDVRQQTGAGLPSEAVAEARRRSPNKAKTVTLSVRPSSIPLPTRPMVKSPGRGPDRGSRLAVGEPRVAPMWQTEHKGYRNQRATMTLESAAAALGVMEEDGESDPVGTPSKDRSSLRLECSDSATSRTAETPESATSDSSSSLTCSLRSYMSSTSVIDLPSADIEMLVQSNALPPFALSLKEELQEELDQLEQFMPLPRAMTPESEVAYYLAQIGDRVQEEYSGQLSETTIRILEIPRHDVTYAIYHQIAEELINASSGWTRVALLLLLSQKLAFALLSKGERNLSELTDFTAHLIEDSAADFIVQSGGWNAVRDIASTPDVDNFLTASPMYALTPLDGHMTMHDHLDAIDEGEDTSQTDSAIGTDYTPETSTAVQQTRDISMDSISSSVWGDAAPPGGDTDQRLEGLTECDASLVQDEIRLLRQVSEQLDREVEERREDVQRWKNIQIFVISTVAVFVAAYVAYKKLHR